MEDSTTSYIKAFDKYCCIDRKHQVIRTVVRPKNKPSVKKVKNTFYKMKSISRFTSLGSGMKKDNNLDFHADDSYIPASYIDDYIQKSHLRDVLLYLCNSPDVHIQLNGMHILSLLSMNESEELREEFQKYNLPVSFCAC